MDFEKEYKRKALEPIVSYIESVMASYSKEELEARIKKALPERESDDERTRKYIITRVMEENMSHYLRELIIAYLEKQKEQKTAEWSEEDENKIESIKGLITTGKFVDTNTIRTIWKLLDSLRPQPHWKPSEEQMKILQHLCEHSSHANPDVIPTLFSLYEDLKKL